VFQLGSPVTASADPSFAGTFHGTGIYSNGKAVNLIANPIFGYTFSSWTENNAVVSTNAILSFVASGPRALVAHFVASPRYSITALAIQALEGRSRVAVRTAPRTPSRSPQSLPPVMCSAIGLW